MTAEPLDLEIKIHASPEVVFDHLIDPGKLVRWQGEAAEFDARPGGSYRLTIFGDTIASGEVLELEPPNRLVMTWGWEGNEAIPPGSTKVEYTLTADGEYTLVRVLHSGLPTPASVEQHREGWTHYLERLAVMGGGGDAGADPWATGAR